MSKTMFQIVATEFAAAFESRVTNHETVRGEFPREWFLKEGSPDWMTDALHDAHTDGRLPDDWIYENARSMVDSIAECAEADEVDSCEIADGCIDVYTAALTSWLASNLRNVEACDEAQQEGLCDADASIVDIMTRAQYILLDRACAALTAAIEAEADRRDEAGDADQESAADES